VPFDDWLKDNYPDLAERRERDREEHAREMKEWKEKNTVSSHTDRGDEPLVSRAAEYEAWLQRKVTETKATAPPAVLPLFPDPPTGE
jgi:hypothetical protein